MTTNALLIEMLPYPTDFRSWKGFMRIEPPIARTIPDTRHIRTLVGGTTGLPITEYHAMSSSMRPAYKPPLWLGVASVGPASSANAVFHPPH